MGPVTRTYFLHLPAHYPLSNDRPTPLVLDYHGWMGSGHDQMYEGGLDEVADEDNHGFMVLHPDGAGDHGTSGSYGSWNCSRTDGPLGPPCALPRGDWGEIHCYDSCPSCDSQNSCDFSSCYDDIAFTLALIEHISATYCLDKNSIPLTGASNGGMFTYFAASRLQDTLATIGPVAASPFIGFGDVPRTPISVIDFHGLNDDTIPYDKNSDEAHGEGPHDSVIAWDGYYYEQKPDTLLHWATEMGCQLNPVPYPTNMDGVHHWQCNKWTGCNNQVEIVHCNARYGHDNPFFHEGYIHGNRILWDFMKHHKKQ